MVELHGAPAAALNQMRQPTWELAQWQRLLSVYADEGPAGSQEVPPMAGVYRISKDLVQFEPRFPLISGVRYRAVFDPAQLPAAATGQRPTNGLLTARFQLPEPPSNSTTRVTHIYPTARVLPENLLKFYIHFSAPMSRGHIYDYIHLRDDKGKDVELPFLELEEELWNPEMTRLTLFIDPGRIKRGVRPLEEVGPSLQQGKRYTLVVDSNWKDASGHALKHNFHKPFTVSPPDRTPPDPKLWGIEPPKAGTRDPVTITFTKPMDQALAQRVIHIINDASAMLAGQVTLSHQERQWAFVPETPWRSGTHFVLIESTLEDLAGNNIGKPFEVDLFGDSQERLTSPTIKLSFQAR